MLKILNILHSMPQGHKESHKKTVFRGLTHLGTQTRMGSWGRSAGKCNVERRQKQLALPAHIYSAVYEQILCWDKNDWLLFTDIRLTCLQNREGSAVFAAHTSAKTVRGILLRSPWIPPQSSFWVFILGCQQWASQYVSSIVPSETNIFYFATWGQQNNL